MRVEKRRLHRNSRSRSPPRRRRLSFSSSDRHGHGKRKVRTFSPRRRSPSRHPPDEEDQSYLPSTVLHPRFEKVWGSQADWQGDEHHVDKLLVYNLALPRLVSSTAFSREQGIAGLPVHLVPAASLLYRQSQNWTLRLIGNGRPCFIESFRTKTEALVASCLLKELRHPTTGIDIGSVLQYYGSKDSSLIGKDILQWDVRVKLINVMAKDILELRAKTPIEDTRSLLQRVTDLEAENAELRQYKAEVVVSGSGSGHPPHAAPSAVGHPPEVVMVEPPVAGANPGPAAVAAPSIQDFQKGSRPKAFDAYSLTGRSSQAVSAWITRRIPSSEKSDLEAKCKTLQKLLNDSTSGDQPRIDGYLVEWGLDVQIAAKITSNQQMRLLCAINMLADKMRQGDYRIFFQSMILLTLILLFGAHADVDVRRLAHWIAARLIVLSVFRLRELHSRNKRLYNLFRYAGVPESYPWAYHERRQVVCLKMSSFFTPWYIGSTTFSVWERDLNRESKMRQIQKKRLAYYEPATHWWHAQVNFSAFVTVVLQPVSGTPRTLLAVESTYQEILEPRLNSPWAHTLLRKVGVHLTKSPQLQLGSLQFKCQVDDWYAFMTGVATTLIMLWDWALFCPMPSLLFNCCTNWAIKVLANFMRLAFCALPLLPYLSCTCFGG